MKTLISVIENERSKFEDSYTNYFDKVFKDVDLIDFNFEDEALVEKDLEKFNEYQQLYFIVDLNLGNGLEEGYQTLFLISENYPKAKLIIFSGHEVDKEACKKLNLFKVYQKASKDMPSILSEIFSDFMRFVSDSFPNILETSILHSEVLEYDTTKVLLRIQRPGEASDYTQWYYLREVDSIENMDVGNNYIIEHKRYDNYSTLVRFKFSKEDLFGHEDAINRMIKEYPDGDEFFNIDKD